VQITQLPKIPAQSAYYLLVCGTGILLFILIGLYPMQASLSRMDEDMAGTKARIEEQKVLFPLYKELLGKVPKKSLEMPLRSNKAGLAIDQIDGISIQFKKMAQECELEATSVTPDVKSLANNSKSMSVNSILRGDFLKLRRFLLELEKLPYLEQIEEIQIRETTGGKEFTLKTWLALSTQKSGQQ
jgi:hypothetical protein